MQDILQLVLRLNYLHWWRGQVQLYTCSTDRSPHIYLSVGQDFLAGWAPGAWTGRRPSFGSDFHRHTQTKERRQRRGSITSPDSCDLVAIGAVLPSVNLDVSKHLWEVVSFGAQAEMVENVLLHGVQVGIFHLDRLPASENSTEYCLTRDAANL